MSLQEKINDLVNRLHRASDGVELLKEWDDLLDEFVAEALELVKDDRISQLETTVKSLRQQLRTAQNTIFRMQRRQSVFDDHDHLPYEEDDRR